MKLIDTHTHLYSEQFEEDREAMIQRAMDAGVAHFYLPSIDSSYTQGMLDLEAKYPEQMHLMMGLHPTYVQPETYEAELAEVKAWLDQRDFAAVGEIGIDLYWDQSTLAIQQIAFETQIQWAKEKNLPIVIHGRDSFDEIFEVLEAHKDEHLFGIFHCFTGDKTQAQQAIDCNLKLGIGGVVTFKNGKIDQFLHEIPLEHLVLETDAPYLAPVPFRGKRNESAYLVEVLKKLSDIYGLSEKEIAQITTENAQAVFKK
ncbi:MAG TPA: TatD family hydrolase [Moheibacter sp.]|nr:TatD family hydrolase [Moheibacter sp.]